MTKHIIPDFTQVRTLVLGDLMLDRYWHGNSTRISPEAPVPIVAVAKKHDRPGGAGNVALNVAALGAKAVLIGVVGKDAEADQLENLLISAGVQCYFERLLDHPTIVKLRVISQHQQLIRLDFENGFRPNIQNLLEVYEKKLLEVQAVILSDYGKGILRDPQPFIQLAKKAKIPVFIDPKSSDFSLYDGATVITPNFKEFQAVVGFCSSEKEIIEKAKKLIKAHHLEALLITRGEQGMTLVSRQDQVFHIPTQAQEVFDVTGAGDTVISVLASAFAAGVSLENAVKLSNLAAGISVSKLGAATVSVPELEIATQGAHHGRLVNEDQLLTLVTDAKENGEKIVMTNGCFDILHAGHVQYLEQAKKLGDRLIVAVNDDASVTRLKGPPRPINPLKERMLVLAGLSSVDWVVPFSEDTPERLIQKILPNVLVKGGDYTEADEIAGAKAVKAAGGEVQILEFMSGCSTTGTLSRLKTKEKQK